MADERWSKGPWGYVQEWDVEGLGKEILDPLNQLRWKAAITFGGLPYIWRELAGPLNTIVYSLLEVAPGDRLLVIGESIGPCGWADDLRGFVAPGGEVVEHELLERARAAYRSGTRGPHGRLATWTWDYTRDVPDERFDAVVVWQAVQHCDDWKETGAELVRVLRAGRRLVLAEAAMFGAPFWARMESDVHLQYWTDKLTLDPAIDRTQVPYYAPGELHGALDDLLEQPEHLEWRGIELFWGRKPRRSPERADAVWSS